MEQYLGKNLNCAHAGRTLILDGRESENPAAWRADVPDGTYQITRTDGRAPGEVRYWGILL